MGQAGVNTVALGLQENMTEEDKSGMVSPSAPVPVEAPKPVMIPMEP